VAVIVEEAVQQIRKLAKHPFLCFPYCQHESNDTTNPMLLEIEWLRSVSLWAHDDRAKHLSNDGSKQKIVLLNQE